MTDRFARMSAPAPGGTRGTTGFPSHTPWTVYRKEAPMFRLANAAGTGIASSALTCSHLGPRCGTGRPCTVARDGIGRNRPHSRLCEPGAPGDPRQRGALEDADMQK